MTNDPFEFSDGAYAVGSMSVAEAEAFEAHLESCDACLRRVAELRRLLPLLDLAVASAAGKSQTLTYGTGNLFSATQARERPDLGSAEPESTELPLPEDMLPTLIGRTRRHQRRRQLIRLSIGATAACVAALAIFLIVPRGGTSETSIPTTTVANAAVKAELSITTHDSWDQVNLNCTYMSSTFRPGNYTAVATDNTGKTELVGTWPTIPGQTATIHTPTTFHQGTVTSVSILDARGITVARLSA